jgi:hypothetical protein
MFAGDIPRCDEPLPRFIDDASAAKLLRAAREHPDPFTRLAVEFLARTGLRKGEFLDLTVDSVAAPTGDGSSMPVVGLTCMSRVRRPGGRWHEADHASVPARADADEDALVQPMAVRRSGLDASWVAKRVLAGIDAVGRFVATDGENWWRSTGLR